MIRSASLRRGTRLRSGGKSRTRLTLKTKTDGTHKVWSNYILTRDKRTCQKCGRMAPQWKMEAAHIFSKASAPRLKYHRSNGIALCFMCHRWYDQHKSTTHDGESNLWVQSKIGIQQYEYLRVLKQIGPKVDASMERLYLSALLRELEGRG